MKTFSINKKILCALLCLVGVRAGNAFGQMTQITAQSLNIGSTQISVGTVCAIAVDANDNPINVTVGDNGGMWGVGPACGVISAGAITTALGGGTFSLPDQQLASNAGFNYDFVVTDTSTGNPTSKQSFSLKRVNTVTGSTWALDHFAPSFSVPTTPAFSFNTGIGYPSGVCVPPSFYQDNTTTSSPVLYNCGSDKAYHVVAGSGGGTIDTSARTAAAAAQSTATAAQSTATAAQAAASAALPLSGGMMAGAVLVNTVSPTIPATVNGSTHSSYGSSTIYSDSTVGNPIDSNTIATFNAAGGRNYGPNEPNVTSGWTTSGFSYHTANFNRRGITQWISGQQTKNGSGDTAGLYLYSYTTGGTTGAADEGWAGIHVNGGESPSFYSGTATSTLAIGVTSIPHSAGNTMCDQCFVVDESNVVASVVFTGPAVVSGSDWLEPIAGTVTPSTAYGTVACSGGIPELAVQTVPASITCNVTGILGTNAGGFVKGVASLAAANSEQVTITAVGTISGGTQSVTFSHQHPNAATGVRLWQGGTMQGTVQSHPYITTLANDMPQMESCFGAPDASHLACGVMNGGVLKAAQTGIFVTSSLSNLTVSGTTVTATTSAGLANELNGLASVVVSGCSDTTINGNGTNVAATTANNQITFTYPGGSTLLGCTSATLSLPTSYQSANIYNYAEQISPDTGNNVALVEPNIMTVHNGDTLVQPHPPTWSGVGYWSSNIVYNPSAGLSSTSVLLDGKGAGVSGGYDFLHVRNQNPFTMYLGYGGVVVAPSFILASGPNIGSSFTEPVLGNPFFSFVCPPAPAGCSDSAQSVLFVAGKTNSGTVNYQGLTGQWGFSGTVAIPTLTTSVGATLNGNTSTVNLTATNSAVLKNTSLIGTVTVPFDGVTEQCLQANVTGLMSGTGSPCTPIPTVFGRTGPIVATTGDYTAAQVTGAATSASVTAVQTNLTAEATLARSASSLTNGTVPVAQLPLGTASTPGAVQCGTGVTCTAGVISATGTSGVSSLNTLSGAVTLAGSSSVTITPSGNTLTLTSSGGSGFTDPGANGIIYRSALNTYTLATPANITAAMTDTTKNSAWGFESGSGGDSSCPSPIVGADYFCYKAGQVQKSHNGEDYVPFMVLTCQPGLGDGLNVIPAGTYLQTTCRNETGVIWTINSIKAYEDTGASTLNVTNGAGTSLLTGAITGTSSYTTGTQSSTVTIAPGDFLKITFVADGTTKQMSIDVSGTY